MDIADDAQRVEEMARERALAQRADRKAEQALYMNEVRVCLWCNQDLDLARLQANPDAVRCVECQVRHERTQGKR